MRLTKLAVTLGGCLAFVACSDNNGVSPVAPSQVGALRLNTVANHDDKFDFNGAPTADHGTCDYWADDTQKLHFTVHDNGDGTFRVRTEYKDGKFVTRAGQSPGACQAETPHGLTVPAGIKGDFKAWVEQTITSNSYNPDACPKDHGKDVGPCGTRSGFLLQVFGCDDDADCVDFDTYYWNFEYKSGDRKLKGGFNNWLDTWPALAPDEFKGDIAVAP